MQRTLKRLLPQTTGLTIIPLSWKSILTLLICLWTVIQPGAAQKLDHRQGEFIIQWRDGNQPADALRQVDAKRHNWQVESLTPLTNTTNWSL